MDPLDSNFKDWLQQRFIESPDHGLVAGTEREREASPGATLMEVDQGISNQSAAMATISEGEVTTTGDLLDPSISGQTSLDKRE